MKKTTIKEYDKDGKLVSETIIEEDICFFEGSSVYPGYPIVTCDTQKG